MIKDDLPLLRPKLLKSIDLLPKLLINDNEVERVESTKLLGVLLDQHSFWKEHIKYSQNKVGESTGLRAKQPNLSGQGRLRELGHFNKLFIQNKCKKATENFASFFLLDTLKTTF